MEHTAEPLCNINLIHKHFMKLKHFLILLIICSIDLNGQENRKYWNDGKLTWSDFSEHKSQAQVTELRYFFGYETAKDKFNDTIVAGIKAYCYMDRALSWVNPTKQSDLLLRYNQVIFDIVELYRRKLQQDLYVIPTIYFADNIFQEVYFSCETEMEKFRIESNNGTDKEVVANWEKRISKSLHYLQIQKYPQIERRNLGYGMHLGFGSGSFTGGLGEYFSPTFNFIFGFDLAYKNWTTFLNATLAGGSKVRKEFFSDLVWGENQSTLFAIGELSLGYAVINNCKFKISPFTGYGFTEFSYSNPNDEEESVSLHHSSLIFGVNGDYKLRKRINLIGYGEYVETTIRTRLYITPINHQGLFSGYSINFTVGINGFGNLIKIKNAK
jgi:hypothetical protein